MYDAIFVTPWPWWVGGPAIGLVVVLLAWLTGKALGVSTGYGSVCAITTRLPFFQAREYTERWRLWFIVAIPLGGLAAALLAGRFDATFAFGALDAATRGSVVTKSALMLGGGVLIGLGARWAGGCPSGHSIVGIAQGAASSLVATIGFMVGGFAAFTLLHALLAVRP